jgi:hypothetical protein
MSSDKNIISKNQILVFLTKLKKGISFEIPLKKVNYNLVIFLGLIIVGV